MRKQGVIEVGRKVGRMEMGLKNNNLFTKYSQSLLYLKDDTQQRPNFRSSFFVFFGHGIVFLSLKMRVRPLLQKVVQKYQKLQRITTC